MNNKYLSVINPFLMKKNYLLLLMILFAHTSWAMPGTLTSVDPDSAYAGQSIGVTVTYPAGVITFASPGSLRFSGNGLPSFSTSWMDISNYDPWNDRMTYSFYTVSYTHLRAHE